MVDLVSVALRAREFAHAPYSGFKVGCALEAEDGQVITGCNIENSTYGLSLCAERVAVFKALSEGIRKFRRVVVVADSDPLTPPCGACRQILWEFCSEAQLTIANLSGRSETFQLLDIFPRPFDSSFL